MEAYIGLDGLNLNIKHLRQNSPRYLKMVEYVLPLKSGRKVLDIGCGYCYQTKLLSLLGCDVSAVDFYYEEIPKIRCRKSRIPFYELNVEVDDLPFEEKVFDAILLGEVIEHLNYSPLVPLIKMKNLLKPGGRLIVTTPNVLRIINMIKLLAGQNICSDIMRYDREPMWYRNKPFYYRHNRLYTMSELKQLITRTHLKVVASGFISQGIYFGDRLQEVIARIMIQPMLWLFPRFRDFIWLVAEKDI